MEDDGWIVGVFWPEFDTAHVLEQAFDRVLAINDGHDDIAVLGVLGAIDDDRVTFLDACPGHGVALDREHEGGWFVANQIIVEIQAFLNVVGGR